MGENVGPEQPRPHSPPHCQELCYNKVLFPTFFLCSQLENINTLKKCCFKLNFPYSCPTITCLKHTKNTFSIRVDLSRRPVKITMESQTRPLTLAVIEGHSRGPRDQMHDCNHHRRGLSFDTQGSLREWKDACINRWSRRAESLR